MRIVVTGTRGIPDIPGGVETHCQQLYPRLAEQGCEVTVVRRSCYVPDGDELHDFHGVKLVNVYAPRHKSIEAIAHTFLATIRARRMHADLVHIHAAGPSLLVPLARLLRLKVVCTNHGPDYERAKWGRLAKAAIHLGEWCQAHWAHRIIAISPGIVETLHSQYGRTQGVVLIPNGVETPVPCHSSDFLEQHGIEPGHYLLAVARMVPEKRLHLLIEAFQRLNMPEVQLVIAGDADHDDDYSRQLKQQAQQAGVILTGYVTGEPLRQLWASARLFVLPSVHEGLPISLLEAMSWHRDVLVSDIAACRLPELSPSDFFATDQVEALTAALQRKLATEYRERHYDLTAYDWDRIARDTMHVYEQLLSLQHKS
ncbi:MAG: glycosyltransferase family 4 protein [Muribaculaceae bacterium]|nr:glycosyltransferase family 4 protein [Muribaculaceae bacterium]